MGGDADLKAITRSVEQIAASMKSMTRVLEALNINLVSLIKVITPEEVSFVLKAPNSGETQYCIICGPGYRPGDEGCNHKPPEIVFGELDGKA